MKKRNLFPPCEALVRRSFFLLALQGRRLTNASRHGIYIINGRKVVVK